MNSRKPPSTIKKLLEESETQEEEIDDLNLELWRLQKIIDLKLKFEKERPPNFACFNCSEDLTHKRPESTLCGHVFCSDCSEEVIRPRKICPVCRSSVDPEKMHRIYLC